MLRFAVALSFHPHDGITFLQAIRMIKFLLESFHVQDEEIQTIHLPIVFSTLSEIIRVGMINLESLHPTYIFFRCTSKKIHLGRL